MTVKHCNATLYGGIEIKRQLHFINITWVLNTSLETPDDKTNPSDAGKSHSVKHNASNISSAKSESG